MVTFHKVNGFDEFVKRIDELKDKGEPIYVLFAGSPELNGISWCPDCAAAHPVVLSAINTFAPENSHFVEVLVGDKKTWKDRNCIFRKNPLTRLSVLPTMQRWGTPFILRETECSLKDLVELLINENPD